MYPGTQIKLIMEHDPKCQPSNAVRIQTWEVYSEMRRAGTNKLESLFEKRSVCFSAHFLKCGVSKQRKG